MTAAASKYTGTCPECARKTAGNIPGAIVAAALYMKATPVPSPIRVNMFSLKFRMEVHARWKTRQPPQRTTGVDSTNWTHVRRRREPTVLKGWPGPISDMAMTKTGTVKMTLIHNRLLMSRNSGSISSPPAAWTGSRAIPQVGQEPGPV